MQEEAVDRVVFAQGVYRLVRDGVEVTLVVPQDVTLSQIAPALAWRAASDDRKGGEDAA